MGFGQHLKIDPTTNLPARRSGLHSAGSIQHSNYIRTHPPSYCGFCFGFGFDFGFDFDFVDASSVGGISPVSLAEYISLKTCSGPYNRVRARGERAQNVGDNEVKQKQTTTLNAERATPSYRKASSS